MKKTLTYHIHEVAPYINWIYFFHAWGFAPRFATICSIHDCLGCKENWIQTFSETERDKAREAVTLFEEAKKLLNILDSKFHSYARFALLPANSDGDDIIIYDSEFNESMRLPLLRQQTAALNDFCLCLSDFIKPIGNGTDKIGLFATTIDGEIETFYNGDDPYKHLLAQTLADRLAEATAEKMHEDVRRTYWGYAPDEHLPINELHQEKYCGIRPAVGYPSLPDQSTNFEIDRLLGFKEIGIQLTENGAMSPHASVSGLIFAHPEARYFSVGKIGTDQLKDYANRKGTTIEKLSPFLSSNILQ
ncbi:MAG: 5-methyltetrahydrofolate--homocysteine methyltransferase [Paraprevotella sp.]|nr:5-methyltetrahydrofolate--homocysteine methyltransferase [Paraprevotella sp.]